MDKKFIFQGDMEDSNRVLYTPSTFAKENLLHLQEIGALIATSAHTNRRVNLSSYLFFLVESGSGSLEYNNVTYPLSAGDCIFIDCIKPMRTAQGNICGNFAGFILMVLLWKIYIRNILKEVERLHSTPKNYYDMKMFSQR